MELDAHALELDTRLMLGVKQGESLCMDLLLQRHRGPVIQFLYRMVRNRAIAEELAQNVFLRVYRSRTTYEPTAKFTSWLFRIATHVALNWLRDRRHESTQLERGSRTGSGAANRRPPAHSRSTDAGRSETRRDSPGDRRTAGPAAG